MTKKAGDEIKKICDGTKASCTCAECQLECTFKPGWFAPGEVEKVATFLGLTLGELFRMYLAVDWFEDENDPIFTLSPAIVGSDSGQEFPADPRGTCIFFEKGRCSIHPVKPFECREALHDTDPGNRHEFVARQWQAHQGTISNLLGRLPRAKDFTIFDVFGL